MEAKRHSHLLIAAGLLLVLAALTTRMLLGARDELSRAAECTRPEARVRPLRPAMAYYLPGNPWVRQAHDTLLNLCRRARRVGDDALALHAYRELRSAILVLRGITRPYADTLPEANRAIAALAARDPQASRTFRGDAGARRLLTRLEQPPEPHRAWAGLGLFGFLLWIGGAVALFFRGLRPDLTLLGRRFWPLLAVVALGFGLFGLGMGLA